MGAWGFGNFENDYAGDWVVYFMSSPNWGFIRKTFDRFENNVNSTEEEVLAAVETIAVVLGNPPVDIKEVDFNLLPVVEKLKQPIPGDLVIRARRIVAHIQKKSNFAELVEFDSDSINLRNGILVDLVERLNKNGNLE